MLISEWKWCKKVSKSGKWRNLDFMEGIYVWLRTEYIPALRMSIWWKYLSQSRGSKSRRRNGYGWQERHGNRVWFVFCSICGWYSDLLHITEMKYHKEAFGRKLLWTNLEKMVIIWYKKRKRVNDFRKERHWLLFLCREGKRCYINWERRGRKKRI